MRPILINSLRLLLLIAPNAVIAAECAQWVAKVESVQGNVHRQAPGETLWEDIHNEDSLCSGDKIRTLKWSRATLLLGNQTVISLDQNSTLSLTAPSDNNNQWLLKLLDGISFFRSRQPQHLQIETPFVNAVHEGTEFIVSVNAEQAQITVIDGRVAAQNSHGKININTGYTGIADAKLAPRLQALTINPTDAVQWSLYYPPIIDDAKTADSTLNKALNAYQQGQIKQAIDLLEQTPPTQRLNHYATLAGLLLSVGRVDAAQALIHQIQIQDPNNSQAYALQAVIAVAKNHPQQALALAKQAVTVNPNSAVAQIALSYAHQAAFNIDAALTATLAATRLSPDNALAWARLSELQLSQGDHKAALKSAQTAQTLNPKLAKTQTILGFADLAQTDAKAAKQAFNQALALDSSDPLARLGLGLAKIRTGELEAGKTDLEIAVNLDPNNAVMRSYLGKAYYELRNKDYAGTEFKIAKDMDPKDPTPWFYDAILKQTTNRPVEALHDMQKAIELNDNRGVYRSSLLLDKDLAARSAAQGRIYNELGFQQLGLLEGWKSVNRDASNYSAHRLLADNYAALPRHELARVSELLQSQLLQPININPIQPNLAESNLFILNGLGPSDLSYNEFNPLFEYNRFALQASGLYGGNNTWGNNVALSGLHDNISFSLGQFHYETDGFRENNFLKKDLYNAFVQGQVTDNLNLQAEYRHEERSNGDLAWNFNQNNFRNSSQTRMIDNYRISGHFDINPQSFLIGSLLYQNIEGNELLKDGSIYSTSKLNGFNSEIQHNIKNSNFYLINGLGHINQNGTFQFPEDKLPTDITRTNIYNYSKLIIRKNLLLTLGTSIDFLNRADGLERNRAHPKFGIEWTPISSTSFRAAAFRGMSMTQVSNQTIEPTQVAGFNQFFDDLNGTVSWRYGAGIDHKFSNNIFTGLEYSERKLDFPGERSLDRSEQMGRAYIYFTPNNFSLSGEYYYEKIDQSNRPMRDSTGLFSSVETHKMPMTISFFHDSGFSLKIKNTFMHQTGLFQKDGFSRFSIPGNSDFFIVDFNISYRLPKRYGSISFGVNNLFDEKFNYQNTSINSNEATLSPSRLIYSRFTLAY